MAPPRIPSDLGQAIKVVTTPASGESGAAAGGSQSFSSLMQKNDAAAKASGKTISPLELAQGSMKPQVTPQSLLSQVNVMQSSMAALQGQMENPNLKMKSSQKYLVKNKLSSIKNGMHSVNAKLEGALDKEDSSSRGDKEEEKPVAPRKLSGPIGQFLGYLTDGVNQLNEVKGQLNDLGNKKHQLTAGDFLLIQVKLAKAQQEMEFTSAVLTKATEDFKTIMNIQL